MAKYNFYAVAIGVDPETKETVHNLLFTDWAKCKPYVVGKEGAKYKGFLTSEEATTWMNQINQDTPVDSTMLTPVQSNTVYDDEFKSVCESLGLFPSETLMWLQKRFVEEHRYIESKTYLLKHL